MKLGCTVQELLNRISSKELSEWVAYNTIEPFGSRSEYIGSAIVASTIANKDRGKNTRPAEVEDFIPSFGPKENQSVESMLQMAEMFTASLGGQDLRQQDNENG